MAGEYAKVGDLITWDRGYTAPHVLRVGHYYGLERLVDGMTRQEWVDEQADSGEEASLGDLLVRGEVSPEEHEQRVSAVRAAVHKMGLELFYDVELELDRYAREQYEPWKIVFG